MLQITYSKGIYTLTDGSKTYTFNINSGECKNTKTDRVVQKPMFKKNDILTCLYSEENGYQGFGYVDMLKPMRHRLDSWGMVAVFSSDANRGWLEYLRMVDKLLNVLPQGYRLDSDLPNELFELSNREVTEVINYVRTYNQRDREIISFYEFLHTLKLKKLAKQFSDVPIEFIREHRENMEQIAKSRYQDVMWYYYYNQKLYMLRDPVSKQYAGHYGYQYIEMYIEYCKVIGKAPIKTNNFMREFLETQNSYDLWLQLETDTRFANCYDRYRNNLIFEYGDYTVVLPTKGQDLVKEGSEMHHCVGGYVNRVAEGSTLIAFIRHKDNPDQCYITAQINPKNGDLEQYYLAYDRDIHTNQDIEFKEKFQEWLHSCQW